MGFETNKRIVKVMNNQRVTAKFNGRKCYFRSKLEYCWALYLQFLLEHGKIKDWLYEPDLFIFEGEITAPIQYRPDFKVIELDGTEIYQETKGYHDGSTNKKLQRMQKHFPETTFELVLQHIPKSGKGVNRRCVAAKYTRRIIDASEIFRQMKGVIKV
jgi:hypothetical protein